jgi:urea transport system substrate-binding protein
MVVGSDAVTFTQQAAAFGLLTPEMGFEGAPLDSDYYPAVAAHVTGRKHVVRWADGLADPQSQAFVAAYRQKTGSTAPIPEVAANAYFGMKFTAAAINEAKAGSREEIVKALGSFTLDSPLGDDTRFVTDGEGNRVFQADMLTATIGDGGYEVTTDHGVIEDVETSCR